MRRLILLAVLLIPACAPKPEDFTAACRAEQPRYNWSPQSRARLTEAQIEAFHESDIRTCASNRSWAARREHRDRWAPAVGIVLGAASSALAEHNFYVYDVPRARRYLSRTR
jgi:hypothetical protein